MKLMGLQAHTTALISSLSPIMWRWKDAAPLCVCCAVFYELAMCVAATAEALRGTRQGLWHYFNVACGGRESKARGRILLFPLQQSMTTGKSGWIIECRVGLWCYYPICIQHLFHWILSLTLAYLVRSEPRQWESKINKSFRAAK